MSADRIRACMARAARGEELTIGFFGGSITQGSLASDEAHTYAYRVFTWWKERFPKAKLHFVNGGIGGTSSHYGAARVVEHLLMYNPDFIVVDFSVNDEEKDGAFFQETYEGVLRRILAWQSQPAVVVLNNVYYDTGVNAQEYHNKVAKHYGVPHVSMKDTLYQEILAGKYERASLTPDNLHPNDAGHALVAAEICRLLENICRQPDTPSNPQTGLPAPLTANAYEYARRFTIANSQPRLCGFRADTEEKCGHLDNFKNGWLAWKCGDAIHFEVEGSCIGVQYRKTIHKPAPVARVTVDGDTEHAVTLDGNFDEDWGDCLYLTKLLHHGACGVHTVDIEIVQADDVQTPFYLLALILA